MRAHTRTSPGLPGRGSDLDETPRLGSSPLFSHEGDTVTPTAPRPAFARVPLPARAAPQVTTPLAFHVPEPPPPGAPIAERARAAVERARFEAALGWFETVDAWATTSYLSAEFQPVARVGPVAVPPGLAHDLGRAKVAVRRAARVWSLWTWEWPDFVRATAIGGIAFALTTSFAAALGAFDPPVDPQRAPRVVEQRTDRPPSTSPARAHP